ncbi:MAG: TetR/AcrR family transcriptional regulator [bacterium]|nr:TetR/AcrR family transcriptional regulator [bacterium]
MARITKEYDERMQEFLDTAQKLFFAKGYDKVSVKEIIDTIGVAKGTFYHYFKTKSDLLDKLAERFTVQVMAEAEKLVKKEDINAIEKLNGFFELNRTFKADNVELMKLFLKSLYNDDNLKLRYKMKTKNFEVVLPQFAEIIQQGIREGCFLVEDAIETAEMIFHMGASMNETNAVLMLTMKEHPENLDKIERKIKNYESCVERILGVAPGSIRVADKEFLAKFKLGEKK